MIYEIRTDPNKYGCLALIVDSLETLQNIAKDLGAPVFKQKHDNKIIYILFHANKEFVYITGVEDGK